MAAVQIVQGFSLLNRMLLYTSFMLAPAQFLGGIGNNCPSNLGFVAYNWYTQLQWYHAAKNKEMHAVSLVLVHVNTLFWGTYLGGVSSGNIWMGLPLGLGSAGVIILNTVAAWTAWATNMPEGYGVYKFFFFGWRTLNKDWHIFILLWQIGDSMFAFMGVMAAIGIPIYLGIKNEDRNYPWWLSYAAILPGAAIMLIVGWPLILWTELLISKNHIESPTDWVAVWLFVVQAGLMIVPSCATSFSCFKARKSAAASALRGGGAGEDVEINQITTQPKTKWPWTSRHSMDS